MTNNDIIGIAGVSTQVLLILGYFIWLAIAKWKTDKKINIYKYEKTDNTATAPLLVPSTNGNSEKFG